MAVDVFSKPSCGPAFLPEILATPVVAYSSHKKYIESLIQEYVKVEIAIRERMDLNTLVSHTHKQI